MVFSIGLKPEASGRCCHRRLGRVKRCIDTSIAGVKTGHWQRILEALIRQQRTRKGRRPTPSAGGIDAQSVIEFCFLKGMHYISFHET